MCYLSKISWLLPYSSRCFLNVRLSSTRLLIKWFLIKKNVHLTFQRRVEISSMHERMALWIEVCRGIENCGKTLYSFPEF